MSFQRDNLDALTTPQLTRWGIAWAIAVGVVNTILTSIGVLVVVHFVVKYW